MRTSSAQPRVVLYSADMRQWWMQQFVLPSARAFCMPVTGLFWCASAGHVAARTNVQLDPSLDLGRGLQGQLHLARSSFQS
jgi:hypothetical protein